MITSYLIDIPVIRNRFINKRNCFDNHSDHCCSKQDMADSVQYLSVSVCRSLYFMSVCLWLSLFCLSFVVVVVLMLIRRLLCSVRSPVARMSAAEASSSVGQRLRLHCRTSGSPEPVVTWFKDGSPITESGQRQIRIKGSAF